MAKIIIPTPLRKYTKDQSSFEVEANTVGDAVSGLTNAFPDIKQHLFDNQGKLRSFIKFFVGDEDIKSLDNEQTPVNADTVISIVPAIAGGNFIFSN